MFGFYSMCSTTPHIILDSNTFNRTFITICCYYIENWHYNTESEALELLTPYKIGEV